MDVFLCQKGRSAPFLALAASAGQKVFKLVKWPNEFHEDPMILANALRFSMQVGDLEMSSS